MVATCKSESKSEEILDKVRVRAMVMIGPGEETAELGQQIAKPMATLTQAGQSNGSSSMPGSPQERGCRQGHNSGSTPSCLNSHNGRDGPGQMTPAHSLPIGYGDGSTGNGGNGQGNQGSSARREGMANHQAQTLSNALGAKGGATWPGNVLPQHWL